MANRNELDTFLDTWNTEANHTIRLMEALPADQYDFRPDPEGRSIGEMAWHLSEIDACLTLGIKLRRFRFDDIPPNLTRPREIHLLAPGYRLIHEEAVERIQSLDVSELDESIPYFDGRPRTIRDVLWVELLHHMIHHRGQLSPLCRQSGGVPPNIYGPNREEMRVLMEQAG